MSRVAWISPIIAAGVLVVGYVGYNEYAERRRLAAEQDAHYQYCRWLVVQMRMSKGEGKFEQLNKQMDTLTLRCQEPEWMNLVMDAPGPGPQSITAR